MSRKAQIHQTNLIEHFSRPYGGLLLAT